LVAASSLTSDPQALVRYVTQGPPAQNDQAPDSQVCVEMVNEIVEVMVAAPDAQRIRMVGALRQCYDVNTAFANALVGTALNEEQLRTIWDHLEAADAQS
jgi:hypothetical protein